MNKTLLTRLGHAFTLTRDLVTHLDASSLARDLPDLPSNRIRDQLWCVIGARESYLRAIEAGQWQGFSCSLEAPCVKASVLAVLDTTRARLASFDAATWSDARVDLAFQLLEHEVQHHGQLIRFVYANGLTFPASWKERYTV